MVPCTGPLEVTNKTELSALSFRNLYTSNQGKVSRIPQVVNCFLGGRYVLVSLYVMIIQHLNSLHFHDEPLKWDSNMRLKILD